MTKEDYVTFLKQEIEVLGQMADVAGGDGNFNGIMRVFEHRLKVMKELYRVGAETDLSKIATCDLIEALKGREGVEVDTVNPYGNFTFTVEGPAIVLTVTD